MASTNDITDVVSGIVKKYIKPKYPIYRISYILVINWDGNFDNELVTEYFSKLVECRTDDEKIWVNLVINKQEAFINSYLVDLYERVKKNGGKCIEGVVGEELWDTLLLSSYSTECIGNVRVIVHDLERVA